MQRQLPSAEPHPPQPLRGYALAFLSALLLSTTGLFIRHLTRDVHLDPLVLAVWRSGFAAAVLFAALGVAAPVLLRVGRGDLGLLAVQGAVMAAFNASWTCSVALTGASLATVLANASAAFTAVLAWWLFRQRLGWSGCLAIFASLAGCSLVSGAFGASARSAQPLGVLLGLLSALCYAVYTLLGQKLSRRGLSPWTAVAYTFAFACLDLWLLSRWPARPLLAWGGSALDWSCLLLLAAGPTVLGFGLYNASLRHLPAGTTALVLTTEPVFTALLACPLLGEWMSVSQLWGGALILGGVALLRLTELGRPEPEAAPR